MSSANEKTIGQARYYHDKKAFINAQVRLLEAPMQLPGDWRRQQKRLENDTSMIPESVISSVLSKVNANSRKSLRLTFNHQSIRQLLEQLESNQHDLRRKARRGGIIIRTKSVPEILESPLWIDMFPETWQHTSREPAHDIPSTGTEAGSSSVVAPSSEAATAVSTAESLQARKYADLRSRIVALQSEQQTLLEKHRYYKALKDLVQRLDTDDIQKNVLSADSQVAKELEKMKLM
ncbi:hypothetical protein BGZ94_009970, partial [Podila epigama]